MFLNSGTPGEIQNGGKSIEGPERLALGQRSELRANGRPAQIVEATLRRRFVPLSYVQLG